jgi:acyl-CoA thioesterase-1
MDEQRAILTARRKAGDATRRRLLSLLGVAALLPARSFAASDREQDAGKHLLILGDSLSAEYGLGRGEGWVNLLAQRATPKGWAITNASISGETTAGGLSRLPSLLSRHQPAVTVIELGANDALRGLSLAATEANLRKMVGLAKAAGSKPLLVGMMMPPNFGAAYARQFSEMFGRIAAAEKVALVPFLLEGFADDMAWFQPDRIHPTAKAQPRMLDNVWPVLSEML